ncbi:MAG: quinone-dependent dihydroorotate dehydrogenase [Chitinophagaceae bacterium]|nr:quinone-dependent dihydroorotate dehydrogenase [Chitinophagaceae bacterium]
MYKLLRNILFWFDAEQVHYFSMNFLKTVCRLDFIKKIISKRYTPQNSPVNVFGLTFKNPVGLAAGFDKNAKYLTELETLGFGFIEIGTVTPLPQKGNDKPRLFRLPKDKALINRMGFNNDGVKEVAKRLKEWREKKEVQNYKLQTTNYKLIIGGNIGKNKNTPNEDAWKDYEICFLELFDVVDYFVVNVSSPNTPGLRELQQKDSLNIILSHLQNLNFRKKHPKPLLVKISPDLDKNEIDDIIDLSIELNLNGIVAANTTISREQLQTKNYKLKTISAGGLSGLPLQKRSTELIRYISEKTNNNIPIIASGGIFAGDDAKEKINAGASLVQVWTGFIYEGPAIVKNICKALS